MGLLQEVLTDDFASTACSHLQCPVLQIPAFFPIVVRWVLFLCTLSRESGTVSTGLCSAQGDK